MGEIVDYAQDSEYEETIIEEVNEDSNIITETTSIAINETTVKAILRYDTTFVKSSNIVVEDIWSGYLSEKTLSLIEKIVVENIGVSENGLSYAIPYKITGASGESGLLKILLNEDGVIIGIRKYIN